MAAGILQKTFSNVFFLNGHLHILIQIQLKFVQKGEIDNKLPFVQIMAWCCIGTKPLSKPEMSQFTDKYMDRLVQERHTLQMLVMVMFFLH